MARLYLSLIVTVSSKMKNVGTQERLLMVTEEAKEKLAIIKKAEAKTNSSIEIEDEN